MINVIKFRTLFSFSSQINVVFFCWKSQMPVRTANREGPDQTASEEAV